MPYVNMSSNTESSSSEDDIIERSLTSPSLTYSPQFHGVKLFKIRWYILFLFSINAVFQSVIWNTWGPIQTTARAVYQWDDYVIDLLAAWGSIAYCLVMLPFMWLMSVKGLRVAVLLAALFQLAGTVLRCIPTNNATTSTALVHLGQVTAGFSYPVGLSAPVLLSSTWFPPQQRTTATAISAMASYIGFAFSFLIGPGFVEDVSKSRHVIKIHGNYVFNSTKELTKYQNQINKLLYVEAGAMLLLFLTLLVYYPAKPRQPPSHSAATIRVNFKNGLKSLAKNYNFMLLAVLFGAVTGVSAGWYSVLDQNLSDYNLNVDQNLAGWLGFVSIISGSFSGILVSVFADHFSGHLKLFVIIFVASSFYIVLLICYVFIKVIPFNTVMVYVLFILCGFFLNGAIPFFFELGVEITYPVPEGITSGFMAFFTNVLQTVFLFVSLANLGSKWMIWAAVGTCAVSTMLLLCVREKYNRTCVDERPSDEPPFQRRIVNVSTTIPA